MPRFIFLFLSFLFPSAILDGEIAKLNNPLNDVNGKTVLFIGDSHTCSHEWGWQKLVCDSTGMRMNNVSQVGISTDQMLRNLKSSLVKDYQFDWVFIYGGANDAAGRADLNVVMSNIISMVKYAESKKAHVKVLTGFDPIKTIRPKNGFLYYPQRYADLQKMIIEQLPNNYLDTRVVVRTDCGDWMCHMNQSGHKKIAHAVINGASLLNHK
jgi:lysophospholipase L1-like esterase